MPRNSTCPRCGKSKSSTSRSHVSSSSCRSGSTSSIYDDISVKHVAAVSRLAHTLPFGLDPSLLKNPSHRGSTYNIAYGRNYSAKGSGNASIIKWVRTSHSCNQENHLQTTLRTVRKSADIIYHFLESVDTKGWSIVINLPRIVCCDGDAESHLRGRPALMEPVISGFTKFNSNSGWSLDSKRTYNKVLQALSHFSYIWSKGAMVLCNLQGGVDEKEKKIFLTDPTLLTKDGKVFGCTDVGASGITTFFRWHQCTSICSHMKTPNPKKIFFSPVDAMKSKKTTRQNFLTR